MPKPLASSLSQHISTIRCEGNGHHLAESGDFTIIVTALMIEEGLDGEGLGRITSDQQCLKVWYPMVPQNFPTFMGDYGMAGLYHGN